MPTTHPPIDEDQAKSGVSIKPVRLALYYRDLCMFCWRVTRVIRRLDIEVEMRNIWLRPEHEAVLRQARGRSTVPVLQIEYTGGEVEWLGESNDIIAFLISHFGMENPK